MLQVHMGRYLCCTYVWDIIRSIIAQDSLEMAVCSQLVGLVLTAVKIHHKKTLNIRYITHASIVRVEI